MNEDRRRLYDALELDIDEISGFHKFTLRVGATHLVGPETVEEVGLNDVIDFVAISLVDRITSEAERMQSVLQSE